MTTHKDSTLHSIDCRMSSVHMKPIKNESNITLNRKNEKLLTDGDEGTLLMLKGHANL